MKTVREDFTDDDAIASDGPTSILLTDIECRVWRKWDELRAKHGVLRLLTGTVENKVLIPILGPRPEGCTG